MTKVREAEKTKLCPYKKIIERDSNSHTGKTTNIEKFAACVGDRCMAWRRDGKCARSEGGR